MKKKIGMILLIIVTISCIYLGVRTREKNGIMVTQIQTTSPIGLSYMLKSCENKIVMIDGGNAEDSKHLEEILQENGGVVESWFITRANPQNFGAMKQILENGKIQIQQIFISFNEASWYARLEQEIYPEIAEFLDLIYSENIIKKVYDVPLRHEVLVDNLHIRVLNVKNPEWNDGYATYNQSMVLKVSNTYKSMIFMGNLAQEGGQKFRDNNLDEINCDAVQVSNNGVQKVDDEVYQKMTPQYVFIPKSNQENQTYQNHLEQFLKPEATYISSNGDTTVKIW